MGSRITVKLMAELPDEAAALRFEQAVQAQVADFGSVSDAGTRRYWKITAWFEVFFALRPAAAAPESAYDGILAALGEAGAA